MNTSLLTLALLGSVPAICLATDGSTGGTGNSPNPTRVEVNGSQAVSTTRPGPGVLAHKITVWNANRSTIVAACDEAVEFPVGGHVVRAAKLRLCPTLLRAIIDGMRLLDTEPFQTRSPGEVDPDAWSRLREGMTKDEVVALVGEPRGRFGPMKTDKDELVLMPEYWEYGLGEGITFLTASPKAHVVYFGEDGKVRSFRGPRKDGGEYDYEDIGTLRLGKDSLESITDRKEGPRNAALKPPIPLQPADRSVFHHYPRELLLRWKPAAGTPAGVRYYVQTDFTCKGDDETLGEWEEEEPMFTELTGKCIMNYRHIGAQPGRWRVKAVDKKGESAWCEWQYFRFTR